MTTNFQPVRTNATAPVAYPSSPFARDVLKGLGMQQKTLPCKYLYDETGSKIFEQICDLDDYYLTRTEADIFADNIPQMAAVLRPEAALIEPGAGNCEKAQPLLAAMQEPHGYFPMDISSEILLAAQSRIEAAIPGLRVTPMVSDFADIDAWQPLKDTTQSAAQRVIFFPGSTIGNFTPVQAQHLMDLFASILQPGDGLLLGADLVKDSVVLERAYCDSEHVTEAFNKNLLARINAELQADFDLDNFAHRAFYHGLRQRVEMHLVSLKEQSVRVAGQQIQFREGETIHTENSHKYTHQRLEQLFAGANFHPVQYWTDTDNHYAVYYALY
mgnify:CR=1 FL=1